MTEPQPPDAQPDGGPYVTATVVLAGLGLVLVAAGAATDSKAVFAVAAAAIAAALAPILAWRAALIRHAHRGDPPRR